ncbi:hypothetical protein FMN50_17815 [Rhodobacterales bacterium]|nr:hypothetical protein FMN50_17815 [Rhodobacterales bacterium]
MKIRFGYLATLGLCLCLGLSACGRKGDLARPGVVEITEGVAADPAVPGANPTEPTEPIDDRTFFLDFLIR